MGQGEEQGWVRDEKSRVELGRRAGLGKGGEEQGWVRKE